MRPQREGTDGDLTARGSRSGEAAGAGRALPEFAGVVVAAGGSTRLDGGVPKQYRDLGGASVVERAVRGLAAVPGVGGIVVVLPPADAGGRRGEAARSWPAVAAVVGGGATRAESVRRGLDAVPQGVRYVLVHDAARPMAARSLVLAVMRATRRDGAAVPGLPLPDTIKELDADGRVRATLDRTRLRAAQTPQGAVLETLRAALDRAAADGVEPTDEAAALELAGHPVTVVAGDPGNFKITTAADLDRARRQIEGGGVALRIGAGFDIHPFGVARRLVLGGVEFEGEAGLAGHSDADVVLHAAMDAMLGAAALPDIGAMFPPDDPAWAGADSRDLAARVAAAVADAGYGLVNLDLTVLAERPRIGPRADEMRSAIARSLGVEPGRIGLKATTLEGLGALGRGEGIACQAVALLKSAPAER